MKEHQRKCFKCGRSLVTDPDVKLFRFPQPGVRNTVRCEAWAKYCFPDRTCSTDFQIKLYSEHRMLCDRHFKPSSFIDFASRKLYRNAVPGDVKRVFVQISGIDPMPGPSRPALKEISPSRSRQNITNPLEVENKPAESVHVNSNTMPEDDNAEHNLIRNELQPLLSNKSLSNERFAHCPTGEFRNKPDTEIDHKYCKKTQHFDQNYVKENSSDGIQHVSDGDIDHNDDESTDTIVLPDVIKGEFQKDEIPQEHKDETPQERIFSWQKDDAVVPCDDGLEYMEVDAEDELKQESPDIRPAQVSPVHVDIRCNACQKEIVGFRYICVQCPDYDLCAACEARGLHHTHYVLRVPGPRPQSEVQEMLVTVRRALSKSIVQLGLTADGTVLEIKDEEEDPLVGELPPPSPSLSHERSEHIQDDPNCTQDSLDYMSDASDDNSDASSHTCDTLYLSHGTEYKRTTELADSLKSPTSSGPIHYSEKNDCDMELSKNAYYNSERNKEQFKITDPNQLCENNTNVCRTDEETPAIECVPKDGLDTIIDIQVIHSEPIDETASNETVPTLDMEFLTSVVLETPEIVNAPECEYTLQVTHMNCNFYIEVKKKRCGDRNEQLREKYCGDKIACVPLTRLTHEEISAATDKQRRTCSPFAWKQNTAKRKTP